MNNDVFLKQTNIYSYNNCKYFNPSKKYPEGLDISIKSDEMIYDEVRNLLHEMHLDEENFGTKKWNPFKEFIKKNFNVVLKPNLVNHVNNAKDGNMDSLITNLSVIRPLIDYTIIALNNTGSILVGDAPVQECKFDKVIENSGLKEAINIYKSHNININLKDFRNSDSKIVKLNELSSLCEVDKYSAKYAITNYDLKVIHEHHHDGKHEYLISNDILNADVIINIPKVKTHRKAGITACMKNMIGVNAKKDYLPHHRNGDIKNNGDEYPERSLIKNIQSKVKNYTYKNNKLINFINKVLLRLEKILKMNKYLEGNWYGNDTIWRVILDINKIIIYANKNGVILTKPQRTIFNFADMIICGEKEGPLLPSNKEVGILIAGFNQLNVDDCICKIMGFNIDKIKYIKNGYKLKRLIISKSQNCKCYSENKKCNLKKYENKFIATEGWKEYLEN